MEKITFSEYIKDIKIPDHIKTDEQKKAFFRILKAGYEDKKPIIHK